MQVLARIKKLFRKPREVVCVEVMTDRIRGARAKAYFDEGKIYIESYIYTPFDFSRHSIDDLCDEVAALLDKLSSRKKQHVIFGFHNYAAVTTRLNVTVSRSAADQRIQEPELEDLLFKAQWRIFDSIRPALSSKMGIRDMDLHLCGAKVETVRLDGHRVMNPLGFRPKKIEFDIANTFISKKLITSVREILSEKQTLELAIESNAALANALLRSEKKESGVIFSIGAAATSVLVVEKRNLRYNQDFQWGASEFVKAIARMFDVRMNTATKLLEVYLEGGMSATLSRKVDKVLKEEARRFCEGVSKILEGAMEEAVASETIFINQEVPLPDAVVAMLRANRWPKKVFASDPDPIVIEEKKLSHHFGFDRPLSNSFTALFAEFFYGERGEHQCNEMLEKRLRWLEV